AVAVRVVEGTHVVDRGDPLVGGVADVLGVLAQRGAGARDDRLVPLLVGDAPAGLPVQAVDQVVDGVGDEQFRHQAAALAQPGGVVGGGNVEQVPQRPARGDHLPPQGAG